MSKKKFPPFKPAKHKWLAEIIRLDSPSGARQTCRRLSEEWEETDSRSRRRLLIKAASEAIRRSKAQLARKKLTPSERSEFREIVKIYSNWLKEHRLR
jgi:hypothetical protein